jgi:hypothetical protein
MYLPCLCPCGPVASGQRENVPTAASATSPTINQMLVLKREPMSLASVGNARPSSTTMITMCIEVSLRRCSAAFPPRSN